MPAVCNARVSQVTQCTGARGTHKPKIVVETGYDAPELLIDALCNYIYFDRVCTALCMADIAVNQ